MKAEILEQEARLAANAIREGKIILYPTDTIWGIGCDATNEETVQGIYRLKKRSDSKSMLVLMDGREMLSDYLENIPAAAEQVLRDAQKPTTIIYPGARNFAPGLLADDGSVGIRLSSDTFCNRMMELCGCPVVSTSANISGEPPAPFFTEISPEIRAGVDHLVGWRQDDREAASPSAIVKIEKDGSLSVIRP